MNGIQNISVISTQTVPTPKPHTTYTVQISTPTRTWTVERRYNDFVALNTELTSSVGKAPPAALPPKHPWSLTRAAYDDKIIRERRVLLEAYLRAILTHRDARWRDSYTYSDFLDVSSHSASSSRPNAQTATSSSNVPIHWTSANWLNEHSNVQALLRQTRSELLKRDALASMGDSTGSRGSSVNAKKILRDIMDRLDGLDRGLKEIGSVLGDGERKRREEMVESLRNERANLQRMVEAGVRTQFSRGEAPLAPSTNGQMPGGLSGDNPWGGGAKVASGRVFGKKAEETDETRPLDDGGLLQLQQAKMDNQDGQLEQLSQILRRQRGMGEEIHREIGEQTEMLEDIDNEVGKVGSKMARAKRQMNKLN